MKKIELPEKIYQGLVYLFSHTSPTGSVTLCIVSKDGTISGMILEPEKYRVEAREEGIVVVLDTGDGTVDFVLDGDASVVGSRVESWFSSEKGASRFVDGYLPSTKKSDFTHYHPFSPF